MDCLLSARGGTRPRGLGTCLVSARATRSRVPMWGSMPVAARYGRRTRARAVQAALRLPPIARGCPGIASRESHPGLRRSRLYAIRPCGPRRAGSRRAAPCAVYPGRARAVGPYPAACTTPSGGRTGLRAEHCPVRVGARRHGGPPERAGHARNGAGRSLR